MLAVIGAGLQIVLILLGEWFKHTDENKQKMKEILKEVPNAKTPSDITKLFDRINRVR